MSWWKRTLPFLAYVLGKTPLPRLYLRRFLPPRKETLTLPGLEGAVEILFDRCGIPHIYAEHAADLFFTQGYCHARDRLWQMELNRLAARGDLAEVFGPRALGMDRFVRRLGFRRAAEREEANLGPAARRFTSAYIAGINAWCASHRLPLEFALLRHRPRPWTTVDSLAFARFMGFSLTFNWETELIRARLIARVGVERAAELEPGLASRVASAPGPDCGLRIADCGLEEVADSAQSAFRDPQSAIQTLFGGLGGASNNWVVSKERSTTGRPLLANDPHLRARMPAMWYMAHLSGDGFDVIGATFPGLLGVLLGHNARLAWGATAALTDCQDLYLERPDPTAPRRFAHGDGWEEAEVVEEVISVKGRAKPFIDEVVRTRHGPLLNGLLDIPLDGTPLAMRSVLDDCASPTEALLLLNRASNWTEFRAALSHWTFAALNFVYADVDGNIGYKLAGRVPIRANGDGSTPVPGWTGTHEWVGYVPNDEMPEVFNPPEGLFATANNQPDVPCRHFLANDWVDDNRWQRIMQLLRCRPRHSPEDMRTIQNDLVSLVVPRFLRYLNEVQARDDLAARALDSLRQWDGALTPESAAAAIYHVWRHELVRHVNSDLPENLLRYVLGRGVDEPLAAVSTFHHRTSSYCLGYLEKCAANGGEAIADAFHAAVRRLEKELGPDPRQWQWGRLHSLALTHPFGLAVPVLDRLLNLSRGPIPIGGDADTIPQAGIDPWHPFTAVLFTVSYRQIFDVGDWDGAQFILPTGQSGHPGSPHYDDLLDAWRQGEYRPLLFSRAAVERDVAETAALRPGESVARDNEF